MKQTARQAATATATDSILGPIMVLTQSQMLELGNVAPSFRLPDPAGKLHTLEDNVGASGYLVMFLCNHCPYVKHVRHEVATLAREYQARGIAIFGINSNDVEHYPDDSPANMAREAKNLGYTFPYLFDESQEVAKRYRAACTPEFYLFDSERRLVYRGRFDASRPGNQIPVDGSDLRAALDALLAGKTVSPNQIPSIGCNIKWKPGNAPEWFG